MRILGIDYGGSRIGLAISDSLGMIAHGLPTLQNRSQEATLASLRRIIEEREVEEVVIGLPRNMNGSLGPQAQKTMRFAEGIKALGRPVHFVDERLTSERARQAMEEIGLSWQKQRKHVDRMAAQFILQAHLDAIRAGSTAEKEKGPGDS